MKLRYPEGSTHRLDGCRVTEVMVRRPKLLSVTATAHDLRRFFLDDHVHMALVVESGKLITAVERADINSSVGDDTPAHSLGSLARRTIRPTDVVEAALHRMRADSRRRLAVVDDAGTVLGLLCLKRDGNGFCSDDDVLERQFA
jgi:predicted transcriptional regulator